MTGTVILDLQTIVAFPLMTMLTPAELSKIADKDFTLEFLRAKLVQQGSAQPRVYEGPGSIFQDPSGALRLTLYCLVECPKELADEFFAELNGQALTPGQLVGPDYYYSFEGIDLTGQTWTASDVAIEVHTGISAGGRIVHSKRLRQIQSKVASAYGGVGRATLIIPGSFRVPFTRGQPDTAEVGFSACTLQLGAATTASLKTKDGALVVDLMLTNEDPTAYVQRVLEALGIAIGALLRPQVEAILVSGEQRLVIRSLDDSASHSHRLLSPVQTGSPSGFDDFQAFVVKFIAAFDKPYEQFADYWFRVLSVFGNTLENQALVLTTATEGVLKAYFPEEIKPDAKYVQELADAKPQIEAKALAIGERARKRLLSSLENAKFPTASNALRALETHGRIPKKLRSVWNDLRNKTSHADELQWDDAKSQRFINDLYSCLELFYRLLMLHIGYEGRLICFSKVGWPDESVNAFKKGATSTEACPVVQLSGG